MNTTSLRYRTVLPHIAAADFTTSIRLLLATLAGLLLSAGYSLHPYWWTPFLAPVPLILALTGSRRHATLAGAIAGAAALASVVTYYIQMTGWSGTALIVAFRILSWVFIARLTQAVTPRLGLVMGMLVLPVAAAALEQVTMTVSHDGAAGSLAYSQGDMPVVEQVAALGGVPAVVFLILLPGSLVGLLLARGLTGAQERGWARGQIVAAVVVFAVIGGGAGLFAAIRLAAADAGVTPVGMLASDRFKGIPRDWDAVWAVYAPSIDGVASPGGLVVLPEKLAQIDAVTAERAAGDVAAAARAAHATIVVGIELEDGAVWRNRALVARPDGQVAWYDKQRLVTGWEARDVPGTTPLLLDAAGARMGVAICKDMHIPSIGREYDAAVMAVPAWDFGRDGWMGAHMTAMRAIENGYAIARSARDGFLGAYDAEGRVIAERHSGVDLVSLRASLPKGNGETAYARVGDVWGWTCVLGVLGLLARGRK